MCKCREEFEKWFLKHNENEGFESDLSKTNGRYNYTRTFNLWIGWQASRESMKAIKLPEKYENREKFTYEREYYNDAIEECKDAITSAGYKVEE